MTGCYAPGYDDSTSSLTMIGRTLSHYEIQEKLGSGGMGDVYRARDTRLERDVAIKFIRTAKLDDKAARELFRREALSLSKLNHPNVQTVFDFDSEDGVDFLVTEYVPGVTLSDRITAEGMPEDEVLELAEQLAAGLAAAHAQGIVHRDLKPGNLRILPDGRLKILDFGLAKLMGSKSDSSPTLSRLETQTFAGTPYYMSPEQRAGRPADARSDIWAAGLVLQVMLTGGSDREATPSVSPALNRILQKCMETDPDNRYQSVDELREDLRNARTRRLALRPRVVRALVIAAAVAAIVAFASLLRDPTSDATRRIESVVALPSEMQGQGGDAFLSDAVPKTLSTYLAQVEGLDTRLPPAGIEIARFQGDLDRIADTYGASALVLSTITAQEPRFVLNVQLVEARGRRLLWSGDYRGDFADYLEVVQRAAEELRQQVRPDEAAITATSATPGASVAASSQAELAFQSGLYYSNQFNNLHHLEDFEASLDAFERALELDPSFSDAAAEIAWLYEFKHEAGMDPGESFPQAHAWAQRTLVIDSENGRAWALLTLLDVGQGKLGQSVTLSGLRAARFAPRFARAPVALAMGLPSCRLAHAGYRESARLDPLYLYAPLMAATQLACIGRMEEALAENEKSLALEPDFAAGLLNKVSYLHELGRIDEARSVLGRIEPLVADGRVHPRWFQHRRDELLAVGDDPEAEAAYERLRETVTGERRFPYWQMFMAPAIAHLARTGHLEKARELALLQHEEGVVPQYDNLLLNGRTSWIRNDPALKPIIAASRQRFEGAVVLLEDARTRGELPPYLEAPLESLLIDLDMR